MTRDEAMVVLAEREGMPAEQVEHFTDDAPIIEAALAPEGQPCADCRQIVVYDDETGWRHVEPAPHCWLAQGER